MSGKTNEEQSEHALGLDGNVAGKGKKSFLERKEKVMRCLGES